MSFLARPITMSTDLTIFCTDQNQIPPCKIQDKFTRDVTDMIFPFDKRFMMTRKENSYFDIGDLKINNGEFCLESMKEKRERFTSVKTELLGTTQHNTTQHKLQRRMLCVQEFRRCVIDCLQTCAFGSSTLTPDQKPRIDTALALIQNHMWIV